MRYLDDTAKHAVQAVIDRHLPVLGAIDGFVSAEPGFPIVDGAILREPAIIVHVARKRPPDAVLAEDRVPRQLGPYRVCVLQADPMRQLMVSADMATISEMVAESASDLTYEGIAGDPIDEPFQVSGTFLCHAGPDAGWPTLKPFLAATESTLAIAMYDFNADYIAKTFIETVRGNNLSVTLTWDDGMTAPETAIRKKLKTSLSEHLDGWIVQCGNGRRFASAYHEKVAVRDSSSFWLSSGNWSLRSQPNIDPIAKPDEASGMYGRGNREWHVIIDDVPLAKLFEQYISHDRDGSRAEAEQGDPNAALDVVEPLRLPDLFVPIDQLMTGVELAASPEPSAPKMLPSSPREITVQPVLTPDNYIKHIVALLKSAKRSVYLQYAYITYSDAPADADFRAMLKVLADLSFKTGLDVRIIVGSSDATDKIRKLAEAGFRETVFRVQSNVHNKGIIVDGEIVVVSSANWSGDGVLRNRDAGLIIYDPEIAGYYRDIFVDDWDDRARATLGNDPVVLVAPEGASARAGMVRMSWRDYYG